MFGAVTDFVLMADLSGLSPVPRQMLAPWEGGAGTGRLPARKDVGVLDIPQLMPHMALVDILSDPLDYRYRLTGTKFVDMIGHDRTGMRAREIFSGPALDETPRMLGMLVQTRAPLAFEGTLYWLGRDYHRFQALCLPLASDGENVDMAMMGLHISAAPIRGGDEAH